MATVSPPQPWSYLLELPRDARAPGIARVTLQAVLDSHALSEIAEKAILLTSELVTNAHRHTDGPCSLRLHCREGDRLRVNVWDTSPVVPVLFGRRGRTAEPAAHAEAGRGLRIVELWADDWGCHTYDRRRFGKTLWFELAHPQRKTAPRWISPAGCTDCVDLEGARRKAVAEKRALEEIQDASIAIRSHFRDTHLLPQWDVR
ncbi:ATP-binding protein [Streptomyces sp. UNOB3_S3]|uniref:ATP-binding protein n=1 Tax=Streptomyces sp. UNOB3_S3 TaxID=2871682 RepID=UPI001E2CEB7C|nr:ATP-binding protein [Streptomyces sp. UNOB3_S3]MCC3775588.1 ATP-binding protein [Streptomyces sp. UNOB3_S3]